MYLRPGGSTNESRIDNNANNVENASNFPHLWASNPEKIKERKKLLKKQQQKNENGLGGFT